MVFVIQIFVIRLIVIFRWAKVRNWIFGITVAIFVAVPGIATYINKFHAMLIPSPQ